MKCENKGMYVILSGAQAESKDLRTYFMQAYNGMRNMLRQKRYQELDVFRKET